MATTPIGDGKPTFWNISGGRHNALSRHRGSEGLWYLVGTWGQGRSKDEWSLMVFPDGVRIGGYAGTNFSSIVTDQLSSFCLLHIRGKGGRDYGKGYLSKGGFRAGGEIPYTFKEKVFDPSLLGDGDEFLRQILGYEPTVEGIGQGQERDALILAEAEAAREARAKARQEENRLTWEENARKRKAQEALFPDLPELPTGWFQGVESDGLHVWTLFGNSRSEEKTFSSLADYQAWFSARVAEKARRDVADAAYRAVEAERAAREEAEKANVLSQAGKMAERLKALKK